MTLQDFTNLIASNGLTILLVPFGVIVGFFILGRIISMVKAAIFYEYEDNPHHFEIPKDEEKSNYYPETKPVAYHQPTNRCPYCGTQRIQYDQANCPKCGGPYELEN